MESFVDVSIFQVNTFISSAFKTTVIDLKHMTAHGMVTKLWQPA